MVYIMGEVLSRAEGYNTLTNLIGPSVFHFVSMFLGGFCFKRGVQKIQAEPVKPQAAD
jgi:hypothetical protein